MKSADPAALTGYLLGAARFPGFVAAAIVVQVNGAFCSPLVLNCEITEGAPKGYTSKQIMINEDKGIVIYDYSPNLPSGILEGPHGRIDLSLKITIKGHAAVVANDSMSAFILTKHDGRFVWSSATLLPLSDGKLIALAHNHWGKCVKSPFH